MSDAREHGAPLGDVLRALAKLRPGDPTTLAALLATMRCAPSIVGSRREPPPKAPEVPPLHVAARADNRPEAPVPDNRLPPVVPSTLEVVSEAAVGQPQWLNTHHPLPSPGEPERAQAPAPLFARRTARAFAAAIASVVTEDGELDIPAIVALVARAEPLRHPLRRRRRSVAGGVTLLIDMSAAMRPYRDDVVGMTHELRRVVGRERVEVLAFEGDPGAGVLSRGYLAPAAWAPPSFGRPVVVLSDFGAGPRPDVDLPVAPSAWVEFGRAAAAAGSPVTALAVAPQDVVTSRLGGQARVVIWDRSTRLAELASARTAELEPPEGVERLAMLASLAVRVEPALLRALRMEVAPELPVWTEAGLWFSDLVEQEDATALILARERLPALWARLKADTGALDAARAVVERLHASSSPALRAEECLRYAALTGDAATAQETLRSVLVAMVREGRDALAGWAEEAVTRLPPEIEALDEARWLASATAMRRGAARLGEAERWLRPQAGRRLPARLLLREGMVEIGPADAEGHAAHLPDLNPVVIAVEPINQTSSASEGERISGSVSEPAKALAVSAVTLRSASGSGLVSEIVRLQAHDGKVNCITFSPDGARLATGSDDGTVRVWDLTTGRQVARLDGHERQVNSVSFSPDGIQLATGSDDNTARLWDVATSREVARLEQHGDWVNSVAFSPDGVRIATGSRDGSARLWNLATVREIARLAGHGDAVTCVAFSPDGALLATASQDRTARLWDVTTMRELAKLDAHQDWVWSLAFSPDGTQLATGSHDGTARLWDVTSGREISRLGGHESWVWSVAFSPDAEFLATASEDSRARIWDIAKGQLIARLDGHDGAIFGVAFSPDGARLATGSADHTARLWDLRSIRAKSFSEGAPWLARHYPGTTTRVKLKGGAVRLRVFGGETYILRQKPESDANNDDGRVHIGYDLEVDGTVTRVEPPFVLGVIADLVGNGAVEPEPLNHRRFVDLHHDNLDALMAALQPGLRIRVPNRLSDNENADSLLAISLEVRAVHDFEPDAIVRQHPALWAEVRERERLVAMRRVVEEDPLAARALIELMERERLVRALADFDPDHDPDGGSRWPPTSLDPKVSKDGETLFRPLEDSFERARRRGLTRVNTLDALSAVARVQIGVSGSTATPFYASEQRAGMLNAAVERIDERLSRQMDEILHHPEFQKLESTWRGLRRLVESVDKMEHVRLRVLHAKRVELLEGLDNESGAWRAEDVLRRYMIEEAYGVLGGEPIGCAFYDFEFDHAPGSAALLRRLAHLAEAASTPMIAGASPNLLQIDAWRELSNVRSIDAIRPDVEAAEWAALQTEAASRFICLTLPRILARLPYNQLIRSDDSFAYREATTREGSVDLDRCTWINAGWGMAENICRAYDRTGWFARITGLNGGGVVRDALFFGSEMRFGDDELVGPLDHAISESKRRELSRVGLEAAVVRGTKTAFVGDRSLFIGNQARGSRSTEASFSTILIGARFAQIARAQLRDRIGGFVNPREAVDLLAQWVATYVADPADVDRSKDARHPLLNGAARLGQKNDGQPVISLEITGNFQTTKKSGMTAIIDIAAPEWRGAP